MQSDTRALPFAAYPLAQLAAAFALGVLGVRYFFVPHSLAICVAGVTTLLAAISIARNNHKSATAFVMVTILFLGFVLGAIEKYEVPDNQLKRLLTEGTILVGEPVELTGVLAREPEFAPERLYIFLRVETLRVKGTVRDARGEVLLLAPVSGKPFQQEFDRLDLLYGARIRVMTTLDRTDTFRNPGVSSFTEYLDRKGYDATGFVKSPLLIERLENERVLLPLAWLYEWRRELQTEIDSRFSTETAGVLDAALLGNRHKLSRSTSERFREGGTFHVLVISGLHISFLGGLIFLIARRFFKNKLVQYLFAVVALWSYSLAVGADPSVIRATLMFTIVFLAPLVFRRHSSLNALGGAALLLLALRPSDLLDPSFQLTFASVLAIVVLAWPLLQKLAEIGSWRPTLETPYPPLCAPWLRNFCESLFWSDRQEKRELSHATYSYKLFKAPLAGPFERLHLQRVLSYAFGAIVVSVCVQIALLPFLVVYFHRLSVASFILNIGVSLMMAAVAIAAVAGLVIAQVSATFAAPLISITENLNWFMVRSVDPFSRVGAASIRLPQYSGWATVVYVWYYVPLAILVVSLSRWTPLALPATATKKHRWRRITGLACLGHLCALALIIFHPLSSGVPDGRVRIDFLDVGQGDAALVTFADGTTLLIDGGGRPGPFQQHATTGEELDEPFEPETRSIGEAVVSEYLWWRGLADVDYILATHADADHIDGLNDVARNFRIGAALVARTPSHDLEYAKFSATASSRGIPIYVIGADDVLHFGSATVTVLWPPATEDPEAPSRNNDSAVLLVQFGERRILFTGDIEGAAETEILKQHQSPNYLDCGDGADKKEDLHVEVVKVPHHGSKTSSIEPFVTATCPDFAVISVGRTSIFGHPHQEVVDRWKGSGAEVLTTGENGMITFTTDGEDFQFGSFVRGSKKAKR